MAVAKAEKLLARTQHAAFDDLTKGHTRFSTFRSGDFQRRCVKPADPVDPGLGMSRSPVREALIRLAGDDLVVALSNRSTVVAPIDVQSFPKHVEALDIAQRMNTQLAAELRTDLNLKTMARRQWEFVAAVNAGRHLAMSEANKSFHMAIADLGRSPYLAAFFERLLNQGRRMLHLHFAYLEQGKR